MASENAERFMSALQEMEQTGNLESLVNLFSDDAELRRLSGDKTAQGKEGTLKFWKEYLAAFGRVNTRFIRVVDDGDNIVLEWVSEANPETDRAFNYEGVSILELENEKIRRFRTYYDTAKFTQMDTERKLR